MSGAVFAGAGEGVASCAGFCAEASVAVAAVAAGVFVAHLVSSKVL